MKRRGLLQDLSFSPSLPPNASSGKSVRSSNRLAGRLPFSRLAASLVARRIRSGRLVKLPLDSAFLTASISSRGGLRIADNRLYGREPGAPGWGDVARDKSASDGSVELAAARALSTESAVTASAAVRGSVFEELDPST